MVVLAELVDVGDFAAGERRVDRERVGEVGGVLAAGLDFELEGLYQLVLGHKTLAMHIGPQIKIPKNGEVF